MRKNFPVEANAAVFICGNLGLSVVGYLVKDLEPLIHTGKHCGWVKGDPAFLSE
jgi:hypothetical protein